MPVKYYLSLVISRSKAGGRAKEICQPKCARTCSGQTLFLDAREAGGLGWNDARGPIKGQPSYVINETMISPGQENNSYTTAQPEDFVRPRRCKINTPTSLRINTEWHTQVTDFLHIWMEFYLKLCLYLCLYFENRVFLQNNRNLIKRKLQRETARRTANVTTWRVSFFFRDMTPYGYHCFEDKSCLHLQGRKYQYKLEFFKILFSFQDAV